MVDLSVAKSASSSVCLDISVCERGGDADGFYGTRWHDLEVTAGVIHRGRSFGDFLRWILMPMAAKVLEPASAEIGAVGDGR